MTPDNVPEIGAEPWTRLAPGAIEDRQDTEALEHAKKVLHDRVIDDLGMTRTSAVTWMIWDADDGAIEAVRDHLDTEEHGKNRDGLIAYLEENPGGALIIATAEARGTPRGMDLPFEPVAGDPVPYNPDASDNWMASGVTILSATGDSPLPGANGERIPIIVFRFQHPSGDTYDDMVLVMDRDQLRKLPTLVKHNVEMALVTSATENAQRKMKGE